MASFPDVDWDKGLIESQEIRLFNLREEIQFTEEMPGAVAVQGSFSKDEGLIECHPFFPFLNGWEQLLNQLWD